MSKKKLKTWVVVLLVVFYPVGLAYLLIRLILWTVRKRRAKKSAEKPAAEISSASMPVREADTTFTELPMIYKKNVTDFRDRRDYIVYDLETTGLDPMKDKIIEISMLRITGGEEDGQFSTLINPEIPIPAEASKVNGITDADVSEAPTMDQVVGQLVKFLGTGYPLVGHNIGGFDNDFLSMALGRRGLSYEYVDTLPMARKALPDLPNRKLSTLMKHYGLGRQTHRALDDVRAAQVIFEKLCDDILSQTRSAKKETT